MLVRAPMKCALALLLSILIMIAAGCGTFMNVALDGGICGSGPRPYGGIALDAEQMETGGASGALFVLDLPLSFVGDTLTLPFTLHARAAR